MKRLLGPNIIQLYITLLFIGFFLYFLFVINPPLYLIKNYREFYTDIYFFKKYFAFPANPAEYLSRLIIQFYNIPFIASLIVTGILCAVYYLGYNLTGKSKYSLFVPFVPVIVLIAMHNDYNHNVKFDIEILLTLFFSFIYFRFNEKKSLLNYLLFPLIIGTLYYTTGIKTVCVFTFLALIFQLFSTEKKHLSLILLIECLAVCILVNRFYYISFSDNLKEFKEMLIIYNQWYLPIVLYLSVIIAFIFNIYLQSTKTESHIGSVLPSKYLLLLIAIPLGTAIICLSTFKKDQKVKLSVQYFGRNKNWNKVLELSKYSDLFNRAEIMYMNRALYFTGRIYNDVFKYNQDLASNGLLATELTGFDELVPNQETYLDLGALSMSIVWGTEATNVYGANPHVLKNLAKAYLAGGFIKEAQKMLNLLDHTLFNKQWVKDYQKFVDDTTLIMNDPELGLYKKSRADSSVVSKTAIELNLYYLTGKTNNNKMAYDYFMIGAILDNNMEAFSIGLTGLKYFGYKNIPKIYFEGFINFSLGSEECPINIEEYTYDQNTITEFKAFQKDYSQIKYDPDKAKKYLFSQYGDTYWYYLKFPRPAFKKGSNDVLEKERE